MRLKCNSAAIILTLLSHRQPKSKTFNWYFKSYCLKICEHEFSVIQHSEHTNNIGFISFSPSLAHKYIIVNINLFFLYSSEVCMNFKLWQFLIIETVVKNHFQYWYYIIMINYVIILLTWSVWIELRHNKLNCLIVITEIAYNKLSIAKHSEIELRFRLSSTSIRLHSPGRSDKTPFMAKVPWKIWS